MKTCACGWFLFSLEQTLGYSWTFCPSCEEGGWGKNPSVVYPKIALDDSPEALETPPYGTDQDGDEIPF